MSVHLRVYAELNDFVKPDEQYTVLRRPFRPHQMESPERTEWPRCRPGAVAGSSSAGNNVTAIQTTDFARAQHQLASRCGAAVIHLMKTATFLMDNDDYPWKTLTYTMIGAAKPSQSAAIAATPGPATLPGTPLKRAERLDV